MYTPTKTSQYEEMVRLSFLEQSKCFQPSNKYIRMVITANFAIPKSVSKNKREQMLNHEILPDKKPDIDNIVKAILDGLNKTMYSDDKQIVELTVKKQYGENPCVVVEYEEIP